MSTGAGEFGLELAIEEAAISRLGNSEGLPENGGYVKTVVFMGKVRMKRRILGHPFFRPSHIVCQLFGGSLCWPF